MNHAAFTFVSTQPRGVLVALLMLAALATAASPARCATVATALPCVGAAREGQHFPVVTGFGVTTAGALRGRGAGNLSREERHAS